MDEVCSNRDRWLLGIEADVPTNQSVDIGVGGSF
jgi:hypothetical protein